MRLSPLRESETHTPTLRAPGTATLLPVPNPNPNPNPNPGVHVTTELIESESIKYVHHEADDMPLMDGRNIK